MLKRLKTCFYGFWNLKRVFWQMMYGIWYVANLPQPIVTIFGGARFKEGDFYFNQAYALGHRLVKEQISVLTGGGPGIMEGASCGAIEPLGSSAKMMGITVSELGEKPNRCVNEYIELDYFFARKWLLTRFSKAFVVFPGGFGTLDEMTEVLTLIQTKKMPRVPIILFGTEYWTPFVSWLHDEALKHGTISQEDLNLFIVTDNMENVFCQLRDECKIKSEQSHEKN